MSTPKARNGRSQKSERKSSKKLGATKYGADLENKNPSFTKKGPGRYHVQGGSK